MTAKKILMIVGDYVEDYEAMVPMQILQMIGLQVDTICPGKKAKESVRTSVHYFDGAQTFQESRGHDFAISLDFDQVNSSDYAGLVLPGGRAPEYLRMDERVITIVKYFADNDLPIAAICHGPLLLATAGVLNGKACTSYPTIEPDLTAVGAEWIKTRGTEAHADGNLVTAQAWPAHPDWMAKFIKVLGSEISQGYKLHQ